MKNKQKIVLSIIDFIVIPQALKLSTEPIILLRHMQSLFVGIWEAISL
jgi:hypothetical protein